jgi:DNA-binding Lrp family transcriptional regulator
MATKNARATKEQIIERENLVIEMLENQDMSIPDIASELGLSYPQTLLIVSTLENRGAIEKIPGRISRKILYKKSGPYIRIDAFKTDTIIDPDGLEIKTAQISEELHVSLVDVVRMYDTYTPEAILAELLKLVMEQIPVEIFNIEDHME